MSKHIHYLDDNDSDGWGWEGIGWYFSDETDELHGPFHTEEEAKQALKRYADSL